ncbi:MAG: class I SAM-dependent methyltransferase [Pseudonocardiales bacterium]
MESTEVRKLAELEDRHWWYAERRHLLARAVRGMPPGVALDVGAAGGGNTRVLRRLGWQSCALEYGLDGAQVAAERGLPVIRADARALPVRSASLDLVVAFDVLEHIVEDAAVAQEIFRALRPGATFLVAVPCDPNLWSAHDDAVDHVRRYTRAALSTVLAGSGFVVESMTSWNVLLRPIVKLRRKSSTGSDLEALPRVVNLALRVIITVERYLPVKRLPGVTLLAVARRPA